MARRRLLALVVVLLVASSGLVAEQRPVAVSPGSAKGALIGDTCPTFSWGASPGADSYELVVYRVAEESEEAKPVLRETLSGSASSWTPSLDRCLEGSGRYAWSVQAMSGNQASNWSSPIFFQVTSGPSEAEFEEAVAVVQRYLEEHGTPPDRAPAAESGDFGAGAVPRPPSAVTDAAANEVEVPTERSSDSQLLDRGAPATVSLVTEGAVGVGTSEPQADLHVLGSPTFGSILVTPNEPAGQEVSELFLSEDHDGSFGMKLQYDGATNDLSIVGENAGLLGPWLTINRDSGATSFFGQVSGITPDPPCFDNTNRFVNCGNGTVTDTVTGMIWLEDANCFAAMSYSAANDSASALAEGQCSLTDGSRPGDWRLPTKEEWEALVDSSCPMAPKIVGNGSDGVCYTDSPWASGVQSSSYWSSTAYSFGINNAWAAHLDNGTVGPAVRVVTSIFVWPVRARQ